MGDGSIKNPYTREDVLKKIEENGGTTKGLDLSQREFERGIDLHGLNLERIILTRANLREARLEEANLRYAHLEGVDLRDTHLERADLRNTRSQEARLRRAQLQEANLTRAHLESAILRWAHLDATHLRYIYLERADLRDTYLERADLRNAHLQEVRLQHAQLQEANLTRANLQGANLHETEFSDDTKFVRVYWGDYVIGEEKKQQFLRAADVYRRLKTWYTSAGMYETAAEFYYREMEATRKYIQFLIHDQSKKSKSGKQSTPFLLTQKRLMQLVRLWIYKLTCGYGEKPWRVVASAAAVIFGLAAAYYFWGSFSSSSFWDILYYSAASFTALGYGQWAPQPTGWAKGIGAAEAVIGVFMIALFLVTFTRKMRR